MIRTDTGWLDAWGNDVDVDDVVRVEARFAVLDHDLARAAGWHQHDLAAAFDFLGAVVEARFDRIVAGLRMTREVLG